jgi:tRNA-dihydrouridine synthase B
VTAVDVPVTLKIRTGWSPQKRNGVTVAQIAEAAGIRALAVHGRTRSCRFNGRAEFNTVRNICQAVSIPVFANGDISNAQQARKVMDFTGADGVMIGRAAQGKPWLCGQVAHYLQTGTELPEPTLEAQRDIILGHLHELHQFYGEFTGVRVARKHIGWYIQNLESGASTYSYQNVNFRSVFNQLEDPAGQLRALNVFFDGYIATTEVKELAA